MGRERTPSGSPPDRITASPFNGLDDHINGFRDPNPAGIRRIRNVFVGVGFVVLALIGYFLVDGEPAAASGAAIVLLLPMGVLALGTQFVLWHAESNR